MDMTEIPMILFTTLAQMCVGAFLVLGIIQLLGALKFSAKSIERFTDPAVFAIGPAMVLGLAVSMLHMHDIGHTLNVLRHWQSSWLSREIIFGSAFAGLGFVFFVLQWKKWGPRWLRQALACLTALVGVALLVAMSNIYYSLVTVPAWHSWFTPFQFVATALLLGSLLVASALLLFTHYQPKLTGVLARVEADAHDEAETPADTRLISWAIRGCVALTLVTAAALLIATPLYVAGLASGGPMAVKAAHAYTGVLPVLRFALLVLGAIILGVLAVLQASPAKAKQRKLACIIVVAFLVVLVGELVGRALFYATMYRVGI